MDLFPLYNSLRIALISTVIIFFVGVFDRRLLPDVEIRAGSRREPASEARAERRSARADILSHWM